MFDKVELWEGKVYARSLDRKVWLFRQDHLAPMQPVIEVVSMIVDRDDERPLHEYDPNWRSGY